MFVHPSRDEALEAVAGLAECMDAVSAASTKGEMDFGINKAINTYWRLYTMFRESKYRDESL